MVAEKGVYPFTVPSATYANINASVYATDDNTFTLSSSSSTLIGTLAGIDPVTGQTWVKVLGS